MSKSAFGRAPVRASLAVLAVALSLPAWSVDEQCHLQRPIVLSHMWSTVPICERPEVTGELACENIWDYERYCGTKSTLPDGARKCLAWRVPDDEADLPPRDRNVFDPTLVRDMRSYRRLFSKEIVSRLRDTCGNPVYIADKPPYASYAVRARVLRATVLQALRETGADQVNIIGMSMGVQDARYMMAVLPADASQPDGPRMSTKVAALVSLVGEDGGADSAGLGLLQGWLKYGSKWGTIDPAVQPVLGYITQASWKKVGTPLDQPGALVEHCQTPDECDLGSEATRNRWFMHSVVNLSPAFMRPSATDKLAQQFMGWDTLRAEVGEPLRQWSQAVPDAAEANNGVRYMSYGAVLRFPQPSWGGAALFYAVSLFAGENDSNVSLPHQRFVNRAPNFENLKVMRGAPLTTGYHHTWFSGQNDAMYGPTKASEQEPAPWRGAPADFWHQVAREMKARGL